jgi:transposase
MKNSSAGAKRILVVEDEPGINVVCQRILTSEGFEVALERIRAEMVRTGSRGVIFAIETGGHYWRNLAYFLDERGIPFRFINQFTLKRRREGKDLNRRKNDYRDSEVAAQPKARQQLGYREPLPPCQWP